MRVLRSRSVRSSAVTAGILALLQVGVHALPWPVWAAWGLVSAWSVSNAVRAPDATQADD